jgi:hypothetical protein
MRSALSIGLERGGYSAGAIELDGYRMFRKPSEDEGSETQQRRCLFSLETAVPNTLIFGTREGCPITARIDLTRNAVCERCRGGTRGTNRRMSA